MMKTYSWPATRSTENQSVSPGPPRVPVTLPPTSTLAVVLELPGRSPPSGSLASGAMALL